jgi:DNA-directed RNA polymerase specialized sigma24 family protein
MCTDSQSPSAGGDGKWVLDEAAFERLLAWLDPERERAGQRYEDIRLRLIKIFTCRGCHESEDLADETINRVARRLKEVAATYEGDRSLYFYGVAHKVYLEYLRRPPARVVVAPLPAPPERKEEERAADEREYECLERCMSGLPAASRDLVLQYYREEKREKIEHRKLLAAQLGIGLNALRIRACRIRETLYQCVQACLGEGAAG